eukprot:1572406-Lingulodinium_polyedra.AAC.1
MRQTASSPCVGASQWLCNAVRVAFQKDHCQVLGRGVGGGCASAAAVYGEGLCVQYMQGLFQVEAGLGRPRAVQESPAEGLA